MPKRFTSKTQKIGKTGEDVACKFLVKHGFEIVERNYTRKWGEIDIIASRSICEQKRSIFNGKGKKIGRQKIHFIEVKTTSCDLSNVSRETRVEKLDTLDTPDNVSHFRLRESKHFRVEENIHPRKIERMKRAVQTYLLERQISQETPWQVDVLVVLLDQNDKKAKVNVLENIIL